MKQFILMILALILTVSLIGCGGVDDGGTTAKVLTKIVVDPAVVKLARNSGYFKFKATGYDQFNGYVFINPTWTAASGIGTIAQSGILTVSILSGEGQVKAVVVTIEGISNVTVTSGTLETIIVTPVALTIYVGNSQKFSATGIDSTPTQVSLYPNWSVSPSSLGIIDDGMFTALATGEGYIIASQASKTGSVEVTVDSTGSI